MLWFRGERNRYTLEAAAGQTMILKLLVSLEDNAVLDLFGPDGGLLAQRTTASIVFRQTETTRSWSEAPAAMPR